MTRTATAEQIVRGVVRGERPWTDLRPLGMTARPDEGRCQFAPTFPGDTKVSVADLAKGFAAHLPDRQQLREWAVVMEALPAEFDAEGHPAGQSVLDALWSASFGEALDEGVVAVIRDISSEQAGS